MALTQSDQREYRTTKLTCADVPRSYINTNFFKDRHKGPRPTANKRPNEQGPSHCLINFNDRLFMNASEHICIGLVEPGTTRKHLALCVDCKVEQGITMGFEWVELIEIQSVDFLSSRPVGNTGVATIWVALFSECGRSHDSTPQRSAS